MKLLRPGLALAVLCAVLLLLPSEQASASCTPHLAAWELQGTHHADSVGVSEARLDDVNNDSFADFIVGASGFNGNQGAVGIFLGSANGLATTPFWTVLGDGFGGFGQRIALAGDVNGDSHPDILISAPALDVGGPSRGRVYLFPGSASGPSTTASWTFSGTFDFQEVGREIAGAGDVNHDGFDDVLISSGDGNSDGGRVYLFYGSNDGLSSTPVWTMEADRNNARFGWSIAGIGDMNADGFDDVAIAATWYESTHGRVFVFPGSSTGLSTDLSSAWSVAEPPPFDGPEFGESIAGAGDVNKDGFTDLVIGGPYHHDPVAEEGVVFLYLGTAAGLSGSPAWHASSHNDHARLGYSVAGIGDFNGDGFSDVVAGAPFYKDEMGAPKGAAFVFLGNPSGLSRSPVSCFLGEQENSGFGYSVAAAGDVNGDGHLDVSAGSPFFTTEAISPGKVYLFNGEFSFADGFEFGSTVAWAAVTP